MRIFKTKLRAQWTSLRTAFSNTKCEFFHTVS